MAPEPPRFVVVTLGDPKALEEVFVYIEDRLRGNMLRVSKTDGFAEEIAAMLNARATMTDRARWRGTFVETEDLALLVRVALGIVRRRRLRGQSKVYDDPVDAIEAVAKKYERPE